MSRRGGLGRGLAALIPPAEQGQAAGEASLAELPVDTIAPNPRQPRDVFDEDELEGLAVSIRDVGVLQPIVVRPLDTDQYELVAGERRLRAAKRAGLTHVPAVVRHTDDADLLKEALVENIHRVQLNPLEEAAAYQQLLEDFGFTQEELAARLGKSRPAISNALRLLTLPPGVQRRVAAGVLSAGHAKALLAVPDPAAMERLADRVVAEGMSVRATEELVRVRLLDDTAPPAPPRARRKVVAPGLVELQDDLSDALMARVRINVGPRKGRLQIDFGSVDDLERIVAVIARGLGSNSGAALARAAGAEAAPEPDAGPASDRRARVAGAGSPPGGDVEASADGTDGGDSGSDDPAAGGTAEVDPSDELDPDELTSADLERLTQPD